MLLASLFLVALVGLVVLSALPALADECHPSLDLDHDGQDETPAAER